jgi:hypothetical protein
MTPVLHQEQDGGVDDDLTLYDDWLTFYYASSTCCVQYLLVKSEWMDRHADVVEVSIDE